MYVPCPYPCIRGLDAESCCVGQPWLDRCFCKTAVMCKVLDMMGLTTAARSSFLGVVWQPAGACMRRHIPQMRCNEEANEAGKHSGSQISSGLTGVIRPRVHLSMSCRVLPTATQRQMLQGLCS